MITQGDTVKLSKEANGGIAYAKPKETITEPFEIFGINGWYVIAGIGVVGLGVYLFLKK